MYTYMHTHKYIYIHIYTCIHMYTDVYRCVYIYIYIIYKCRYSIVIRVLIRGAKVPGSIPANVNYTG